MKKIIGIIIIIIVLIIVWYIIGGIHLSYLKQTSITKATEVCDEGSKVIYEGYQRAIMGGFGGHVWYLCKIDNIPVEFYIARRINNPELQVYNIEQVLTMPTSFQLDINK